MTESDSLVEGIRELAHVDERAIPVPGSARFEALWQDTVRRLSDSQMEPARSWLRRRRTVPRPQPETRRTRRLIAAVAAVTCAAGGVVVAVSLSDNTPSSAAVIAEAATLTGDLRSFRAELTSTTIGSDGEVVERHRTTIEVSGDRAHLRATSTDDPPDEDILIGDTVWDCGSDGTWASEELLPEDRPRPFAAASASLVDAVLASGAVENVGDEEIGNVAVSRYRLEVNEAARERLAALPKAALAWFDLDDDPSDLRQLDVWIDEDQRLIHRIDATSTEPVGASDLGTVKARITFAEFREPIDIQPPTDTRC